MEPPERYDKTPRGKLEMPRGVAPLQYAHHNYLRGRKFKVKKLERLWEIKGIGIAAELSWRIFIPIFYNGTMVSWTTRSIVDKHKDRYVSASPKQESIDHKELLYGEDYCRHSVVLCEGPTDVWRIGPGAVCSFGTTYSRSQVLKLSQYPVRVICYDDEPEAQHRADELCNLLAPFDGDTFKVTLNAKDPGEALEEEIEELRQRFLEV